MTETERSSRRVQHGRKRQRHIIHHSSPVIYPKMMTTRTSDLLWIVVVYAGLLLLGLSQGTPVSAWSSCPTRRIVTLPSRSIPSRPVRRGPLYQAISASTVSTPSSPASTTTTTSSSSTSPVTSHPGENDEEGNSAARRWLGILSKGSKKKGVSDVKLREAEELGGLPRSDRYSSRYVFLLFFIWEVSLTPTTRVDFLLGVMNVGCHTSHHSMLFFIRTHTETGFTIPSHYQDRRF